MRNIFLVFFFLISFSFNLKAQIPSITAVDPEVAPPLAKVVITGAGFGSDPAQVQVWFGAVLGRIISVSPNLIEVRVPPAAHADNISVINLASDRGAKSPNKFFIAYNGAQPFDVNEIGNNYEYPFNARRSWDVCACDFNRDGLPDLAVTRATDGAATSTVDIFTNTSVIGDINFTKTGTVNVDFQTSDIKCSDLNNDGYQDLVMTRGPGGGDRRQIFYAPNNAGTFGAYTALNISGDIVTERIQIQDLNSDGLPEIVVSNSQSSNVYVFRNTSSGTISYNNTPISFTIPGIDNSTGLEVQDLNGDTRPELILSGVFGTASYVVIVPNTSGAETVSFGSPLFEQVSYVISDLITGDFNNDKKQDIAVCGFFGQSVTVLRNQSAGEVVDFAPGINTSTGRNSTIEIGDVNGDGFLDIVTGTEAADGFSLLLNNAGTGFVYQTVPGPYRSRNISINDFDGDAKPDFAIASFKREGTVTTGHFLEVRRNQNCYSPQILGESTINLCPGQTIRRFTIPSPGSNYVWELAGVEIANTTDPFVDVISLGNLTVTAIQEGGACSETSDPVSVISGVGTVPGDPAASNDGPACIGGQVQLTATAVVGATYNWKGPNGFTSNLQNPILDNITALEAGEYCVTIQVGDCQSSESCTLVEVETFPAIFVESSTGNGFCEGTASQLCVASQAGYTYAWYKDGGAYPGTTACVSITNAGSYYAVITNSAGCSYQTEPLVVQTTLPPTVDLLASTTDICVGGVVDFDPQAEPSSIDFTLKYQWNFGDGGITTLPTPSRQYNTAGSFNASVIVSYNEINNCQTEANVQINVADAVPLAIDASVDPICPGEESTLSIAGTFDLVNWNTGETTTSIVVDKPGIEYSVEVLASNGCEQSAFITLASKDTSDLMVLFSDSTINRGDTIQLVASGADFYTWTPVETLIDDPSLPSPRAVPEISPSIYKVLATSVDGCSEDSLNVTVRFGSGPAPPPSITPQKAFAPDNANWQIGNIDTYPVNSVVIFDRRGRVIKEINDYDNISQFWDGSYNGDIVPAGVYYFIVNVENYSPYKGSILVVR